jgi:hypothetical protein
VDLKDVKLADREAVRILVRREAEAQNGNSDSLLPNVKL